MKFALNDALCPFELRARAAGSVDLGAKDSKLDP